MAQPNLAPSAKPLLTLGPITGIDATTDPYYVDGTYGIDALNLCPNRNYGGFTVIRGRVLVPTQIPISAVSGFTIFYIGDNAPRLVIVGPNKNDNGAFFYLSNAGIWTPISVPQTSGQNAGGLGEFTEYDRWLFFSNGDPHGQAYKFDTDFTATYWQIYPPVAAPTQGTIGNTGKIYGSGYSWSYTYSNDIQESSPNPLPTLGPVDLGIVLGPPGSSTVTQVQPPTAPTVTTSTAAGHVPPGTYQVGVTYLLNTAPFETGLSALTTVTLAAQGTLAVSCPSPPTGASIFDTYVGSQGGLTLQGVGTPVGSTNTLTTYSNNGSPPPAGTGTTPPEAPSIKAVSGGSLPERTEYYVLTLLSSSGETLPGPEAYINLQAGQLAQITSPTVPAGETAIQYNVYGSDTSTQEVKQNASPIALGTNWTEPSGGINLGQSIQLHLTGSNDTQVTDINVYRIGGALGQWTFLGTVANAPGAVLYTDNTPDSAATGQNLVLHRDPPAPFTSIFTHQERVCGFSYPAYTDANNVHHDKAPCDLWLSNYKEPWGFDNTNQVFPVGATTTGDVGVTGGSLGSIAVLLKRKTFWALYGTTMSDFFVQKLFDIGCVSKRSVVFVLGIVAWLSEQGFYMFDGSSLNYLSKPVKKILDAMSAEDFQKCAGTFNDRMFWWSFPTLDFSLGYDTVSQSWWKAGFSSELFAYDPEGKARPAATDLVYGADVSGDKTQVSQWFAATTDYGRAITSAITSRLVGTGAEVGTLRVRYLELLAASISAEDTIAVTANANPGTSIPPAFTWSFFSSNIPRQLMSAPPGLQGQELQLTITAQSVDELGIEGAALHGWVRRKYNVYG